MKYWVIEHPTKGYYIGTDYTANSLEPVPRFKWSVSASHDEVEHYYSEEQVNRWLEVVNAKVKGQPCRARLIPSRVG